MYYTNEMTALVMFATNYNPNFIEEVWGQGWAANVITPHWDTALKTTDSYGRMVKFWTLLSDDNREKLTNYIKAKYVKTKEDQELELILSRARVLSTHADYQGCSVHVCRKGDGTHYIDDFYDPSCIATFVNGVKQ